MKLIKKIKFNPTTPLEFYYANSEYVQGEGLTTRWRKIITNWHGTFWGEWKSAFGNVAISAQTMGVNQMATIRMHYNPEVLKHLQTKRVLVVRNMDRNAFENREPVVTNPNVFEIWGGVDNVEENNQIIEFRVRRFEKK